MEASRAKTSAVQELEKAWKESEADFFSRSYAWPKKSNPRSYSLRTYLPLAAEGDFKSLEKLPNWGMIVGGVLYPLRALEQCTKEKDGSSWQNRKTKMIATPRASVGLTIVQPCPSAREGKHGEKTVESIGRLNPELIGKKLCPMFVESLMGYPTMWTGLKPLEIA